MPDESGICKPLHGEFFVCTEDGPKPLGDATAVSFEPSLNQMHACAESLAAFVDACMEFGHTLMVHIRVNKKALKRISGIGVACDRKSRQRIKAYKRSVRNVSTLKKQGRCR